MKTYASFDVGRKHMAFVAMREDGTVLTTGTGIIVTQDQALHEHDIVTLDAPVIGTLRHTMHKLPVDA